jgi:hypothetical protein
MVKKTYFDSCYCPIKFKMESYAISTLQVEERNIKLFGFTHIQTQFLMIIINMYDQVHKHNTCKIHV